MPRAQDVRLEIIGADPGLTWSVPGQAARPQVRKFRQDFRRNVMFLRNLFRTIAGRPHVAFWMAISRDRAWRSYRLEAEERKLVCSPAA